MNDRIRQFMSYKGLTSSELADSIGIQRSNLTHVLNGRNKPSFPFISKLLEAYPEINAKWVLLGQGEMLENLNTSTNSDLFSIPKQAVVAESVPKEVITAKEEEPGIYEKVVPPIISGEKQVDRIVVFYTDQTFKSYTPSK